MLHCVRILLTATTPSLRSWYLCSFAFMIFFRQLTKFASSQLVRNNILHTHTHKLEACYTLLFTSSPVHSPGMVTHTQQNRTTYQTKFFLPRFFIEEKLSTLFVLTKLITLLWSNAIICCPHKGRQSLMHSQCTFVCIYVYSFALFNMWLSSGNVVCLKRYIVSQLKSRYM